VNLVASSLIVLSLTAPGAPRGDVDEERHAWQFRRALEGPPPSAASGETVTLGSLELPPEVLARSRRDLGDLRLVDLRGGEWPYALITAAQPEPCHAELVSVSRREKVASSWTVSLGEGCVVRALRLGLEGHDFAKSATVELSVDGKRWTTALAGAAVFDQRFGGRVVHEDRIRLPAGEPARFVRVTLDDVASAPVEVRDVEVLAGPASVERWRRDLRVLPPRLEGEWHEYELAAEDFPLEQLELAVADPLFARDMQLVARQLRGGGRMEETVLGAAMLYRQLALAGARPGERLTLEVQVPPPGATLVLRVHDRSDRPLSKLRATATGPSRSLVFVFDSAMPAALYYGNPQTRAPGYDLGGLVGRATPAAVFRLQGEAENPLFRPQPPLSFVESHGAPLELERFAWQRALTLGDGDDVYAVVPEPSDLARVRPDLGDLRLVDASGAQVPYVLERHAALRLVPVALGPATGGARKGVSRQLVTLQGLADGEALPVEALELEVKETFFSRAAFVTTPAEGGRRVLYTGALERGAKQRGPVVLPLHGARVRELALEVEDGDNAPLSITAVRARIEVPRLAFKAKGQATGLRLLYGAPRVAPPSYDLAALSAEVLAYAARPVTLGPAGPNPVYRHSLTGGGDFTAQRTILWIALVVLVAWLLLVIVRMVRKLVPQKPRDDSKGPPAVGL
jgi:hypothetical protein